MLFTNYFFRANVKSPNLVPKQEKLLPKAGVVNEKGSTPLVGYQLHVDGYPVAIPDKNLEAVRIQASSLGRFVLGRIVIIDLKTGCEIELQPA